MMPVQVGADLTRIRTDGDVVGSIDTVVSSAKEVIHKRIVAALFADAQCGIYGHRIGKKISGPLGC